MKKDIKDINDIKLLVDTFYKNANSDKVLGPIFESYLSERWDEHHETFYRFWQTVILKEMSYYGKPVPFHFTMHLDALHFDLWVSIWRATVDSLFQGEKAERAKLRGKTMSDAFLKKIKKHESNN